MGGKGGAPASIVPLTSLFMILLTFFISLLTLANEQEAGLVGAGTGSFVNQPNARGGPEAVVQGSRTPIQTGPGRPLFGIPERELEETQGTDSDLLYSRV